MSDGVLGGATTRVPFEEDLIMATDQRGQKQPDAAHAQPIDPVVQSAEPAETGKLQEVLPQIKDLSQQVGGIDKLSDIVDSLKGVGH